jgi:short-subunit dehydrogenase
MKELNGKNCFLTGAASGIGRSFAKALAKEGMNLFISDINLEGLEQVKTELEQNGTTVYSMKCDVTKLSDIEEAANLFFSEFEELDLLINNAGIGRTVNLKNMNLENWNKVLQTNLWSVIYALKVFLPHMIERKSGHIVNVASMAGIFGSTEPISYVTTKFAVVGLSEGLFSRLKPYGINVSVVTPGLIRTNIFHSGLAQTEYDPRMVEDHGKEKLDEIYGILLDNLMNAAMSPDVAVRKYLRKIKKNELYVYDTIAVKEILNLKGTNMKEYEQFLLKFREDQSTRLRDTFKKFGINYDDYT